MDDGLLPAPAGMVPLRRPGTPHGLRARREGVRAPAWRAEVDGLVAQGIEEAEARRRVKVPVPSKPQIQKRLNEVPGDGTQPSPGYVPSAR